MNVLEVAFAMAKDGDRILITFPDTYSFLIVSKWIAENYGNPFWVIWTDAAVERINHFGEKYNFPINGEALVVNSLNKRCKFLDVVDYVNIRDDFLTLMKYLPIESEKIILLFGIDFLKTYDQSLDVAIRAIVGHDKGIMVTTLFNYDLVKDLLLFHDIFIEISESKDASISYCNYVASLKFSMREGVVTMSYPLVVNVLNQVLDVDNNK